MRCSNPVSVWIDTAWISVWDLARGAGVSSAGEPIEYWLNNAVYDAVSDSTLPITEEL